MSTAKERAERAARDARREQMIQGIIIAIFFALLQVLLKLIVCLIRGLFSKNKTVRIWSGIGLGVLAAIALTVCYFIFQTEIDDFFQSLMPEKHQNIPAAVRSETSTVDNGTTEPLFSWADSSPKTASSPSATAFDSQLARSATAPAVRREKSIDRYLKMEDGAFIEECRTVWGGVPSGALSRTGREPLASVLVFRDAMRSIGVSDAAFKDSFASGGLFMAGLADGVDNEPDLSALGDALDRCFALAPRPAWKREELKIRICLHRFLHDESDRSMHLFAAAQEGAEAVEAELLVCEGRELLRVLRSKNIEPGKLPAGNTGAGSSASSAAYAERLLKTGQWAGVFSKWIAELGRWGIAWNVPANAPNCTPVLASPGFPCEKLVADKSRLDETLSVQKPGLLIYKNGDMYMLHPRTVRMTELYDFRAGFPELTGLKYLVPWGVVTPKGNVHREAARKYAWKQKLREEWPETYAPALMALAEFGGFPLGYPPLSAAPIDGDMQKDVPLQKPYRYFQSADLRFSKGAMTEFTLKAHFASSYSWASVKREYLACKTDVAQQLKQLAEKNPKVRVDLLEDLFALEKANLENPNASRRPGRAMPWTVVLGNGARHGVYMTISVEFDLAQTQTGYDMTMSVYFHGMQVFLDAVVAAEAAGGGDELPVWREGARFQRGSP